VSAQGAEPAASVRATWLMMRCTSTTRMWMWLAMSGRNSVMKLSMGAVPSVIP
jgi:hypothetical protein